MTVFGRQIVTEAAKKRLRNGLAIGAWLGVLAAAGTGRWLLRTLRRPEPRRRAARRPVPVSTARATRQDVSGLPAPGLGAVQAFNSVLVRARVDGTLMDVPVTEGQEVKQGDADRGHRPAPVSGRARRRRWRRSSRTRRSLRTSKRRPGALHTRWCKQDFASHQTSIRSRRMVDQHDRRRSPATRRRSRRRSSI